MDSAGIVREWDQVAGLGVIDSPDTPGGCWVHFSAVALDGYRALDPGEQVTFTFEPAAQDGFSYRALEVRTKRKGPDASVRPASSHPAYSSELRIYPNGL